MTSGDTSHWNDCERIDFIVDGRDCILVFPAIPLPERPWIWRTEFFDAFPQADIALLQAGFHVAYMDVQNLYGAPVAIDYMDKFYAHVKKQHRLEEKVVLEGFSRGGLFAFNWAARNPEKVSCIYVDAPVCDFKSWPGGKGRSAGSQDDWFRCKEAYGLSEEEALAYAKNPVDNLEPLARAQIDILSICGESDSIVPFKENTGILAERYRALGGKISVIVKPGGEHHPHSLEDPSPIVDFIQAHRQTGERKNIRSRDRSR